MIPNNITRDHLIQAIQEIDDNGITKGRHSSTYDLVHNDRRYPPKLVISIANRFANGEELDHNKFSGGLGTSAFKKLNTEGFSIEEKVEKVQMVEEFQKEWPIDRLKSMTLEEYTNNDLTSFTYWLEFKVLLASIKGGSSYKFGIYKRKDTAEPSLPTNCDTDGIYSWHTKYGKTKEDVFNNIRQILLQIAQSSINNDFKNIDNIDFSEGVKWKTAFLFNPNNLIPIKKRSVLEKIMYSMKIYDNEDKSTSEIQSILMDKKPKELDTIQYALRLWSEYHSDDFYHHLKVFIEQSATPNLKKKHFPKKYNSLKVKVGFVQGTPARVSWIAFLAEGQTVQKGIYPVYLLYKNIQKLVLAYGVSETNSPEMNWEFNDTPLTISSYFTENNYPVPDRYGSSFIYKVYDISDGIPDETYEDDLNELIDIYQGNMSGYDSIVREETPSENGSVNQSIGDYTMKMALEDLFIEASEFNSIVDLLGAKQNIILQGPPGVGKTFIAKRIAYSLLGVKDDSRVEMIQFHQSYSYEDFIQGYRPTDEGTFALKNGVFYNFCIKAQQNPNNNYVFIIDEINRGNLSKIFGELMLLVENDKRGSEYSISLTYSKKDDLKFYIPGNLYIIGMMNTADRSLAMVDYALRRRFCFIDLIPQFGSGKFKDYLLKHNVDKDIVDMIVTRMNVLNAQIGEDSDLGNGYQMGHSFFTPNKNGEYDVNWYSQIIKYEVEPLIREYWFDNINKVESAIEELKK